MARTKGFRFVDVMKDMGGAGGGIPIVTEANARGHEEIVITEGIATARCRAANIEPLFAGPVNFQETPFSMDARRLLELLGPDAVVCSMGSPINIEQTFGYAANSCGIPLIHRSDFWGAATRSCAAPDLVLAIDSVDETITRTFLSADEGGRPREITKIVAVGNHAISALQQLVIPDDVREKMENLKRRFGIVLLFAGGGGDYTTAELQLLKRCLAKTAGSWVLVPRFHPKWMEVKKPEGGTYGEEWRGILGDLGDQVVYVETPVAEAVASLADATIAGFSTLMTSAVYAGKCAISLATSETRASLKRQTRIARHPLVGPGLVTEITEPSDLTPNLESRPPRALVEQYLKPLDAVKACDEIEKLAALK